MINLYLLLLAQKGKTFNTVEAFLSALSFCFKFYLVRDFVQDPMIKDMKRFVAKVCKHGNNKKKLLDPLKYAFYGTRLTNLVDCKILLCCNCVHL